MIVEIEKWGILEKGIVIVLVILLVNLFNLEFKIRLKFVCCIFFFFKNLVVLFK